MKRLILVLLLLVFPITSCGESQEEKEAREEEARVAKMEFNKYSMMVDSKYIMLADSKDAPMIIELVTSLGQVCGSFSGAIESSEYMSFDDGLGDCIRIWCDDFTHSYLLMVRHNLTEPSVRHFIEQWGTPEPICAWKINKKSKAIRPLN